MNVEKFIRLLGYIVYVILWTPLLVLIAPISIIAMLVTLNRVGATTKEALQLTGKSFMNSIRHDIEFIRTGIWY